MGISLRLENSDKDYKGNCLVPELDFLLAAKEIIFGKGKIEQALKCAKFLSAINQIKLPVAPYANVWFFTIPDDIIKELQNVYSKLKNQNYYHRVNYSFADFTLVTLAYVFKFPVVSLDNHILNDLTRIYDYDSIWPRDLKRRTINQPFLLLDTNILLGFNQNDNYHQQEIKEMMNNNQYNFLIPKSIISELKGLSSDPERALRQHNPEKKNKPFKSNLGYKQHYPNKNKYYCR